MKQSQVCINRGEGIIINANGIAHHTGYVAIDHHRAGAKTVTIYKGKYYFKNGCHITETTGARVLQYPSGQPFPLDDFLRLTGWTPSNSG